MKQFKNVVIINAIAVIFVLIPGIFSLVIFSIPNYRRDIYQLYLQCKTCPIAKEQAIKDFNSSKFKIVRWGLDSDCSSDTLLKKEFNIKIIHGGCVPNKEVDCYRIQMIELLHKKFGDRLFPL